VKEIYRVDGMKERSYCCEILSGYEVELVSKRGNAMHKGKQKQYCINKSNKSWRRTALCLWKL